MTEFSESGRLAGPETTEEETLRYDESKNCFHLEIQTLDYGLSGLNLEQRFSQVGSVTAHIRILVKIVYSTCPKDYVIRICKSGSQSLHFQLQENSRELAWELRASHTRT